MRELQSAASIAARAGCPLLQIRSASSPMFRRLLALRRPTAAPPPQPDARQQQPASVLVEGRTLIDSLCASSSWRLLNLLLSQRTLDRERQTAAARQPSLLQHLTAAADSSPPPAARRQHRPAPSLVLLPSALLERLSRTASPCGYVAEFLLPAAARVSSAQSCLLLDALSDPGNVGAIARSAQAFGFSQLAQRPGGCSPFNPKAVAASAGGIARLTVADWGAGEDGVEGVLSRGRGQRGSVLSVALLTRGGRRLRDVGEEVRGRVRQEGRPLWLLIGHEADGLTAELLRHCEYAVTVEMSSEAADSLNAATAAAIAAYALSCQR